MNLLPPLYCFSVFVRFAKAVLLHFLFKLIQHTRVLPGFINLPQPDHTGPVGQIIKSTPSLLVCKGEMLSDMMKKERIDQDEIYAVVRENGLLSISQVHASILETNGSLTLLGQNEYAKAEALSGVKKPAGMRFEQGNRAP